jgi:hypothetical protein
MATPKTATINSSSMNFEETLRALPYYFKAKNIVPLIWGDTGLGKTELVEEYCASKNMDCIVIHVAQLEPADFVGLYKITEDGRTSNCPPNWLPYKTASGKEGRKLEVNSGADLKQAMHALHVENGEINPNGGIVFLDEVNRGHEDMRQAMYQFLSRKRIHTYQLPANYYIVGAANPSSGYEVQEFDPALINRFAHLRFLPDAKEVFKYLTGKHSVNPLVEWLKTDPKLLDLGDASFPIDGLKLSPRLTEEAIIIWKGIEDEDPTFQRKIMETLMVPEKVQSFLSFQEELKHCTWQEVLAGKKKDRVKDLLGNGTKPPRLDVLSTLVNYCGEFFGTYEIGKTDREEIPKAKEREYLLTNWSAPSLICSHGHASRTRNVSCLMPSSAPK